MAKDAERVLVSARIKIETKERLESYCKGELDDEKHIQEDVIELAVSQYLNFRLKLAQTEHPTKKGIWHE